MMENKEMSVDHVVFFSGGMSSWALAKRVAEKHGNERLRLLFTDTLIEDKDLYRFLDEAAKNVGGELVKIADGRTPWEVFKDERYLGNSRADPCSKILKRQLATKWVKENYPDPESVQLWIGMNWDEEERLIRSRRFWEPYKVDSMLMQSPWLTQKDFISLLKSENIEPPRLYNLGFPHNNCGGGCIKAGQAHFRHLLNVLPEVYAEWEAKEEEMRKFLNRDVSILTRTVDGKKKQITLKQLREQKEEQCDLFDWGGCGCFAVSEEDENI